MEDKKQIEEMAKELKELAKIVRNILENRTDIQYIPDLAFPIAKELLKHYQPKLPENAVVFIPTDEQYALLSKEEYEKLKNGNGRLERLYERYPYRVLVGHNSMVFSQNHESVAKLFNKIDQEARKETAKEILTCVKEFVVKYRGVGCGVHPLVFDLEELAKRYGVEVE